MKKLIYAVYDSKVESYLQPLFFQSKGEAMRSWQTAANDQNTMMCQHPEDFTLFELGSYDEQTGKFENHNTPISVGVAIEFKRTESKMSPRAVV